ncbi:MAG: hypothetical protein MJ236_00990 [Clostridia bacterium]|nr:hypothetical protein [Clostridia bacterium]
MEHRGPGDFIAESGKKSRQSGDADLRMAEIIGDRDLLYNATAAAKSFLESDPNFETKEGRALKNQLINLDQKYAFS